MAKLLVTVTGSPEKGGTFADRNKRATQPPTSVPASSPATLVAVARPLGAKVTDTLPEPVGPSAVLQLPALAAAAPSAATAAFLSKAGASDVSGASGFFAPATGSAGFVTAAEAAGTLCAAAVPCWAAAKFCGFALGAIAPPAVVGPAAALPFASAALLDAEALGDGALGDGALGDGALAAAELLVAAASAEFDSAALLV